MSTVFCRGPWIQLVKSMHLGVPRGAEAVLCDIGKNSTLYGRDMGG